MEPPTTSPQRNQSDDSRDPSTPLRSAQDDGVEALFATMKSWLWNGRAFQPCGAVPISDRGFRYGMSLFESILVRNRALVFLTEHLARLRQACAQCGFQFDEAALTDVEKILRENCDDGLARIYVTAGDGTVTSATDACRVFVFYEARAPIPTRVFHRGYDLGIAAEPHHPLFNGLKTANYWPNLAAFRSGVARQKNETLLFNHAGGLISACMANVFIVRNGRIRTPSPMSGARPGVLRAWVMQRREVAECVLGVDDLNSADEIFLTSSWLGIMPVALLEERALADKLTARQLRAEYEMER